MNLIEKYLGEVKLSFDDALKKLEKSKKLSKDIIEPLGISGKDYLRLSGIQKKSEYDKIVDKLITGLKQKQNQRTKLGI